MGRWNESPPLPPGTRTFSRRELLRAAAGVAAGAVLAPSLVALLAQHAAAQQAGASGSAKRSANRRLVFLWLEGGPSQLDTFDPKPGEATGGAVKGLATDVQGWSFADSLPQLAKRAGDLAVIRSMTSKEGNHARARMLVQCGQVPNPTVSFPSLGSIVAHELGDLEGELPAFVQVNGAPIGAGYLGVSSSPFVVNDPLGKIENLAYAGAVDGKRLNHRSAMVDVLDDAFAKRGGAPAVDSNRQQRARARRLMDSKLLAAFDLAQEKDAVRDAYGRGKFGQGVLLARRLLDHGVQAVQVVLGGWDTHNDNSNRTRKLNAELDPAFAALIDDLKKRSALKDTLIVCMGEFGRTPDLAGGDGRNHWPSNWCVALAGGGIKGGTAWGETDAQGRKIAANPATVGDLFATMTAALRIDGAKTFETPLRPITLVERAGQKIEGLLE